MDLTTSSRSTGLPGDPAAVWAAVADGTAGPRWYLDSLPLRLRGVLDRLVGGGPWEPAPGGPLLRVGDRAGFWEVLEADAARRSLLLEARVRAPGRVVLRTEVTPAAVGGCELAQSVSFSPRGVLGAAYLLADLPARELLIDLVHRRTCDQVRWSATPT